MSKYEAFFNQHKADVDLAKDDFIQKFSKKEFDENIQPFIDKGVMSMFDSKPTKYTKYYFEKVSQYALDRTKRKEEYYRGLDFSKSSNAESLKPVRKFGVREDIRKLDALYNLMREKGYKPRIVEVSDVGPFYSIKIKLKPTLRQIRKTQEYFFNMGFNSATYKSDVPIELGLYVHIR